jgi:hypothetical protein
MEGQGRGGEALGYADPKKKKKSLEPEEGRASQVGQLRDHAVQLADHGEGVEPLSALHKSSKNIRQFF